MDIHNKVLSLVDEINHQFSEDESKKAKEKEMSEEEKKKAEDEAKAKQMAEDEARTKEEDAKFAERFGRHFSESVKEYDGRVSKLEESMTKVCELLESIKK